LYFSRRHPPCDLGDERQLRDAWCRRR
jgi:hypothetical protein